MGASRRGWLAGFILVVGCESAAPTPPPKVEASAQATTPVSPERAEARRVSAGVPAPRAADAPQGGAQGGTHHDGELPVLAPEVRKRLEEGMDKVRAQDLDGAEAIFTEVITQHPEVFDAYDHRSMIYYNRQQFDKVAEDCSRAIDLARKDGTFAITCPDRCLTRRGASYLNLSQWDRALVDFNEVLQYKPQDGFTYFERGRALFGLGRMEEAKADFEKALQLDPNHPVASQLSPYYLKRIADPDYH